MFSTILTLAQLLVLVTTETSTLPPQCVCGYRDPVTQQLSTDALIVYFNETDVIDPEVFSIEDYAHKKEQGWNAIYKQGAKPENVRITNYTAIWPHVQVLDLQTDPAYSDHLVNGGVLQSVRKDIQYGSFQAALKSAAQWTGGTALSMMLRYNTSDGMGMDFMNMKDPADAGVSNLVNGEWPSLDLVTNYTYLEAAGLKPWDTFINARMDYNDTNAAFYIEDNATRILTEKDRTLPKAGQSLLLKSWSTGDTTWMEGPPSINASHSHVLWIRAFFNSSTMTNAEHESFDRRCADAEFCSTADMRLRNSTAYTPASTLVWHDAPVSQSIRKNAGIVAACCSSFGIFALINVFFRRAPWHKLEPSKRDSRDPTEALRYYLRRTLYRKSDVMSVSDTSSDKGHSGKAPSWGASTSSIRTPLPAYGTHSPRSGNQTPVPGYESPLPAYGKSLTPGGTHQRSVYQRSITSDGVPPVPALSQITLARQTLDGGSGTHDEGDHAMLDRIKEEGLLQFQAQPHNPFTDKEKIPTSAVPVTNESNPFTDKREISEAFEDNMAAVPLADKSKHVPVTVNPIDVQTELAGGKTTSKPPPPPAKRIDYLAGLVAVACMGVTLHHFCQTFWPWVTNGYGPGAHYKKAEKWLQIFLGSYLLTALWIGPFFLTATRFLSTNYFKNGNLEDIAKKELRRAPRLFVPIIITSLLEYFLLSMGLGSSLQWLASVSWSTWPYVVQQPNFGAYLNNIVELLYLMPNAIPEIVTHYCIGVLWTVPVQLQFTYVVLTATVLIRDIKNPWKRFGFYTFVIVSGWYARSWSACHWCGLLLSDLEATYKWKVYLQKHPLASWAVIVGAFVCAGGAPLISVFSQEWSFDTFENSIHPDFPTGKPSMRVKAVYPDYNEPTLTILLFSIGLQILVELSPLVQKFLSLKIILWLHPHIMTVYLTHGFVMWTWGAWCAISLNSAGVPYWANLLVTLVTTYTLIFLLATVLTPLMDVPTQAVMRALDRWTKDEPVAKRETTAPFSRDIVRDRNGTDSPVSES